MYLALCMHPKIFNICEFQDDPIIRGYDSLVDYLLQSMSHLRMFYFCTSMPYTLLCIIVHNAYVLWITRDLKLNRGRMLYRVAQNKWDHLLKLYIGWFLTIKINYHGIVVSVCVFNMVKPVQCLLNMDRKWTHIISDCMLYIIWAW